MYAYHPLAPIPDHAMRTQEATHSANCAGELGKKNNKKNWPTLTNGKGKCGNRQVRRKWPLFVKLTTIVAVLVTAMVGLSYKKYSRYSEDICYII